MQNPEDTSNNSSEDPPLGSSRELRNLEQSVHDLRTDRTAFSYDLLLKVGKIEYNIDSIKQEINKLANRDAEIMGTVTSQAETFRKSILDITERFSKQIEDLGKEALKRQDVAWIKSVLSIILGAAITAGVSYFISILLGKPL